MSLKNKIYDIYVTCRKMHEKHISIIIPFTGYTN